MWEISIHIICVEEILRIKYLGVLVTLMILIQEDGISWSDENSSEMSSYPFILLQLFLYLALLVSSFLVLNKLNFSQNVLNISLEVMLLITGLTIRRRYLHPDFSLGFRWTNNYDTFRGVSSDMKIKKIQIIGSILVMLMLPLITILMVNFAGVEGIDLFYTAVFHYVSIILGLVMYPIVKYDKGKMSKESLKIEQNYFGMKFMFEGSTDEIKLIGLLVKPVELFENGNIMLSLLLDQDYYCDVQITHRHGQDSKSGRRGEISQILDRIKDWIETNLDVPLEVFGNKEDWNRYWENKKLVKRWV